MTKKPTIPIIKKKLPSLDKLFGLKKAYGEGRYGDKLYEIDSQYVDAINQIVQKRIDEDLQYFRDKIDKAFEIK